LETTRDILLEGTKPVKYNLLFLNMENVSFVQTLQKFNEWIIIF